MIKAIDHCCLQVSDLKKSRDYYASLFEFDFRSHPQNEKMLMVENEEVHFFMEQSGAPSDFLEKQHISFEVDDLDEWRNKLEIKEIEYEEGSFEGFRHRNYDWIEWRDIDGVRLEVVKVVL